ncbi:dockerin type I repeat-containing protein [Ruminococcus flavefaciens]|uniref:Dockerin domain-containing protein n=1 Tax=Ruminococcus flavefaciens TaxID=1265 RepID=A0A1M7KPS7_RUMFL|nr:dockerin type I repeat-containing protein [Ruminococcus flavefaciens]SHM66992.1 hypothetical protein SAMN04487860_109121 [Ruminococcus flavefaciens]
MQKAKEKGILCVLLAFLMSVGVLAGVFTPKKYALAAEDFRMWRQLDDRWGNTAIGGTTVRKSGCYITSIAMVAVASGARDTKDFDPGVFAKQLNDMGAFSSGGALIAWASINKAVPEISIATANLNFKSKDQKGKAAEMKEYLDKGMYVICNVGGHWVYVDGIIGDDVYMADPAKDDILMFKAYNNSSITFYQALNGKNKYSGFTPLKTENDAKASSTTTTLTSTSMTTASTTVTSSASSGKTSTTTSTTSVKTSAAVTSTLKAAVSSAAVKAVPKEYKTGEYYCTSAETVRIYADVKDSKSAVASLEYGNIVNVLSVNGSYGEVKIGGKKGWADLEKLEYAGAAQKLSAGDINGDGSADAYDLALVNEYITSREKLPEGVSVLTSWEIKAADLSDDGEINNTDVLLYLMRICN